MTWTVLAAGGGIPGGEVAELTATVAAMVHPPRTPCGT